MSDLMDMMARLTARWGELHIDVYRGDLVVVSDRDAAARSAGCSRTYEGTDLFVVLETAIEGEGA